MNNIFLLRKRLFYQSCHRGCKETDAILGTFAKRYLEQLNKGQLDIYEAFLEEADGDIFSWVSGQKPYPSRYAATLAPLLQSLGGKLYYD